MHTHNSPPSAVYVTNKIKCPLLCARQEKPTSVGWREAGMPVCGRTFLRTLGGSVDWFLLCRRLMLVHRPGDGDLVNKKNRPTTKVLSETSVPVQDRLEYTDYAL